MESFLELERSYLMRLIEVNHGNICAMQSVSKLGRATVYRLILKHDLREQVRIARERLKAARQRPALTGPVTGLPGGLTTQLMGL